MPVFYNKSTIVSVDDDALVLKAVSQLFDASYQVKTFNNPYDCLGYFNEYTSPLSKVELMRGCREHEYYETSNHSPVDFDVTKLHAISGINDCTDEVSVLIVDYNMPQMNGIELCRRLGSLPMKKILLTGEGDLNEAINAFNNNTIDRYLRKDSPSLGSDLQLYVNDLSRNHYYEYSKPLISHLEADVHLPVSDPVFVEFFHNWCVSNSVREYALIDKNGSFMVVNHKGERSCFVVHTDRTLNNFIALNDDNDDVGLFLSSVSKREKIPYFGVGRESWEFDGEDWDKFFFTPTRLEGKENYYWVVVNDI